MKNWNRRRAIPVEGEALQRLEEKLRFSYPYPADTVTPRRMAVSELAGTGRKGSIIC